MKRKKTKIKQFGQDLKKLCKEEVVIATIGFYGHDHKSNKKKTVQPRCNVVATIVVTMETCRHQILVWSQPQILAALCFCIFQCGRDRIACMKQSCCGKKAMVATTLKYTKTQCCCDSCGRGYIVFFLFDLWS